MNVYVVSKGVRGEGQLVERAFASLASAKRWISGRWHIEAMSVNAVTWMATWNGVDEVWIFKLKVAD